MYYDLGGESSNVMGNVSSAKDQFTVMEIDVEPNLKYITIVLVKVRAPEDLAGPTPLLKVMHDCTKWDTHNECMLGVCTIPKIFPVFFGRYIRSGSLIDNTLAELQTR